MRLRNFLVVAALGLVTTPVVGDDAPDIRDDLSFGVHGRATVPAALTAQIARGVIAAADGGVAAVGDGRLFRVDRDGAPDERFGAGGVVASYGAVVGAFDSAGRYVSADESVYRVGADGVLDASFAGGGWFPLRDESGGTSETAAAVAVLADDSVLVLGATCVVAGSYQDYSAEEIRLTRLTADGALDPAYGDGGRAVIASGYYGGGAGPMLASPDGSALVVVGTALHRITASGSRDASFGTNGVVTLALAPNGIALAVDGEGRILACGAEGSPRATALRIVRLLADGAPDPEFGGGAGVRADGGAEGPLGCAGIVATGGAQPLYVAAGAANVWGGQVPSFVAAVRADAPASLTVLSGSALHDGDLVDVTGLAAAPGGRVYVSATERAKGWAARSSFVVRLRFDGQDGVQVLQSPPDPPPAAPAPSASVIAASWPLVRRAVSRHGAPTARVEALLQLANRGDAQAPAASLRVLLSRDAVPGRHDRRLATVAMAALEAGAMQDAPLRLRVPRRARRWRLLVVDANVPALALAVSAPLP